MKMSDTIFVVCPGCKRKSSNIPAEYMGRKVKCKGCGHSFQLETDKTVFSRETTDATVAASAPSEPVEDKEWAPGDLVLNLYEVTGILGKGGMGKVFRVHHRMWNMDLAVKSPLAKWFRHKKAVENFTREAETWVGLGLHPHIVSCYYVRIVEEIPRIFAEFVEGGSLEDLIRKGDELYGGDPDEVLARILDIAIQFAWGLDYAHEKGLIHQDVKPANVMMTKDGVAKVTDFGLANAKAAANEAPAADSGQSMLVTYGGMTPVYCSPEQSAKNRLSRGTDIWSWAVSLLEMFTGEVVWQSGMIAGMSFDSYHDMFKISMPEALADLLRHCFQENPADRPKTMRDVAETLQDIHRQTCNQSYGRSKPASLNLFSDSLNNRGVSLLDLGKKRDAEKAWEQALQHNPKHMPALFNQTLLFWRAGQISDQEAVVRLENGLDAQSGKESRLLFGKFLAFLHHDDRARDTFEKAGIQDPSYFLSAYRIMKQFKAHQGEIDRVLLSPDARLAVSIGKNNRLKLWDLQTGNCLYTEDQAPAYITRIAVNAKEEYAVSGYDFPSRPHAEEMITMRLLPSDPIDSDEPAWRDLNFTDYVRQFAVSADHQYAATAHGRKIILWDLTTGRFLRALEGHTDPVNALVFDRSGRYIISASGRYNAFEGKSGTDSSIRIWEVNSEKWFYTGQVQKMPVTDLAVSLDGVWMAAAGMESRLQVFRQPDGKFLTDWHWPEEQGGAICFLLISHDNKTVIAGNHNGVIRQWDRFGRNCVTLCRAPAFGSQFNAAVSPDGKFLLCSFRNQLQLMDIQAPPALSWVIVKPISSMETADIASKFKTLLQQTQQALNDGDHAAAHAHAREARGISGYERHRDILPLWERIIARFSKKQIRDIWLETVLTGHQARVNTVQFTPDGQFLVSGSHDQTLRLWDLRDSKPLQVQGHSGWVTAAAVSSDGRYAAAGCKQGDIYLWDLDAACFERGCNGHRDGITSLAFSTDGNYLFSGSYDGSLCLWDVKTGHILKSWRGPGQLITCLAVMPDGRMLLSGDDAARIYMWDAFSGALIRTFQGHQAMILCLAVSPDGQTALSGSDDKTLRVWDMDSGRPLHIFTKHENPVYTAAFSPDGRHAISGGGGEWIYIWDMTTKHLLRKLRGVDDSGLFLYSLAFSPTGRHIAAAGQDGRIFLWYVDQEPQC